MSAKNIYLLLLAAILAGSCTTIQPRNVSDELYQTPSRETGKIYTTHNYRIEKDTSEDLRSSRHHDIQRAPYWMYERYPYHPYYYNPFDFYNPYGIYPRFYSFYPNYGWGFGYYPFASWYGYNWYGSYYSPYYTPYQYGLVRNYQRKITGLPSVRSNQPFTSHTQRYRKNPQIPNKQGTTQVRKYTRQEHQRKYTPPKRYIRATKTLRPVNLNHARRSYTPTNNNFQRKPAVRSLPQNIHKSTPVYRPPAKAGRSTPVRSSSFSGRKRR